MIEEKPVWQSKTIWGGAVAVVAAILGLFGYSVSSGDQALIVEYGLSAASAIGGLVAIYGRLTATKVIK